MAPSKNGPGQEGIKFNQCAGFIFHETEKAEEEGGQWGGCRPPEHHQQYHKSEAK